MQSGVSRTLLIVLFILVFCPLRAAEAAIHILANEAVKTQTLSPAQVRLIFAGRTQFWPNGERVKVFVLHASNPIHTEFCRNVLQIYPYQLERIWQRNTYSGQGDAPIIVNSIEDMVAKVAATPGSIGYVNTETPPEGTYLLNIGERE